MPSVTPLHSSTFNHRETYGRNLIGKLDVLGQGHGTLLQRALKINILDIVAKVGFLVDDADQTVLDLKVNLGAFLDVFAESTASLDGEGRAAVDT